MTELVTLKLEKPVHGGACLAKHDGKAVFVLHGIAGETVAVRFLSQHKNYSWAEVVDVLNSSEYRVPHIWQEAGAGGVGGAELGHVELASQRSWKSQVLMDVIRRIGGEDLYKQTEQLQAFTVVGSANDGSGLACRTRAEFTIASDNLPAMNQFRSKYLINIHSLPLARKEIQQLDLLQPSNWQQLWKPGDRVRVVAPIADAPIVLINNQAYETDLTISSRTKLTYQLNNGIKYKVSARGFWQVHQDAASLLEQQVRKFANLSINGSCLELYSGAGLFTKGLAKAVGVGGQIISIEGDKHAVLDAKDNLANCSQVKLHTAQVAANNVTQLAAKFKQGKPDILVADPPRAGAGKEVMQAIANNVRQKIVLVFCDPAAYARDAKVLIESGWKLSGFKALDLFPHTHHMEVVALFEPIH